MKPTGVDSWSELALLRFALALIVTVNHLPNYTQIGPLEVVHWFGAFEAVLGFLAVSGYSIGRSYLTATSGFLRRRAMRVYPIYLAAVVLTFAAEPQWPTVELLATIGVNLLFLNQILTTGSYVGPAWSLSLEVWCYALTPLLVQVKRPRLEVLVAISFTLFVLHTIGRTLFHWPYYAGLGFGLNLPLLGFAWVIGLLLATERLRPDRVLVWLGAMYAAHMALATAIQFASDWRHGTLEAFWTSSAPRFVLRTCTLLVVWLILRRAALCSKSRTSPSPWMRVLGDMSYPLYLLHAQVFSVAASLGAVNPYGMLIAAIASSGIAYLLLDGYSRKRHLASANALSDRSSNPQVPLAP